MKEVVFFDKEGLMRKGYWLIIVAVFMMGFGCASPSPEKTDNEQIRQNAGESMENLKKEENRHKQDGGY